MVVLCSSPRPAREAAVSQLGGLPGQQVPLLPAQLCCTGSSLTWRRQRAGVGVSSGSRRPRRGLVSEYKLKLSVVDTFWQPLVVPPVEVIFGQKSFSPRGSRARHRGTVPAAAAQRQASAAGATRPKRRRPPRRPRRRPEQLPARAPG